jgi:hypothetical protein
MASPKQASEKQPEPKEAPVLTVEDSVQPPKAEVKPKTVEQTPNGIIIETF